MAEFLALFMCGTALLFLPLVLLLMALSRAASARKLTKELDISVSSLREMVSSLTGRVSTLEKDTQEANEALAKLAAPSPGSQAPAEETASLEREVVASGVVSQSPPTAKPDVESVPEPVAGAFKVESRFEPRPATAPSAVESPPRKAPAWPAGEPPRREVSSTPPSESPWRRLGKLLRVHLNAEEWEAVVGGSWLNKIGVLVLVVGLVLFVGYSLTHLGAVGRLIIGFSVSAAMLVGGFALERRGGFQVFARGLLGGGWAALYFTTYAMHGLEAARVIADPLLGVSLLALVAGLMIAHSLRYRSEIATTLALLYGFITIFISPVDYFATLASVPLIGAVVAIAHRNHWIRIAVLGLIAAYSTYAYRVVTSSVVDPLFLQVAGGQLVLVVYWVLFEGFDLASLARRRAGPNLAQTLFPLNAFGFLGVSLLQWTAIDPPTVYVFLGLAAAAYLVNTLLRARIRPTSSFEASTGPLGRAVWGGYESSVTVATTLAVAAIALKLSGIELVIALLLEGGLLFFSGLMLRQTYLRTLASVVFLLPLLHFLAFELPVSAMQTTAIGVSYATWTPIALLLMAVFYMNRCFVRPRLAADLLLLEHGYSYAAAALLALVVAFDVPLEYAGMTWLAIGALQIEVGIRSAARDFRVQGGLVAAVGVVSLATSNGLLLPKEAWDLISLPKWFWLLPATLVLYLVAARIHLGALASLTEKERAGARRLGLEAAALLLAVLTWHALPAPIVALGWAAAALLMIECGFRWRIGSLRAQGHVLAALACGRLFLANFANPGVTGVVSHRLLTVTPIILLLYYLWSRLRQQQRATLLAGWESWLPRVYAYAPAILLVLLMRFELGRVVAVVGWSVLCLALFYAGTRGRLQDLRWQGYLLAMLIFIRSWAGNFNIPESLSGAWGRVLVGVVVIASLYAAQFLAPRGGSSVADPQGNWLRRLLVRFDANARNVFSVLATILTVVLIYYEVSGRLLTVAWSGQGAALLVAGFLARERVLRISGMLMLILCVAKVFALDLRGLEVPVRILSFVVLGLLLIGVSWLYARYRTHLQHHAGA